MHSFLPVRATCPAYLNHTDLITLTLVQIMSSSLCSFLHRPKNFERMQSGTCNVTGFAALYLQVQ